MLNLRYNTSFPKNANQSGQLTVLTMSDSGLSLCAARFCFYDFKKVWLQSVHDEMEMVWNIYQILRVYKFVMLQKKGRKSQRKTFLRNKDSNIF